MEEIHGIMASGINNRKEGTWNIHQEMDMWNKHQEEDRYMD